MRFVRQATLGSVAVRGLGLKVWGLGLRVSVCVCVHACGLIYGLSA